MRPAIAILLLVAALIQVSAARGLRPKMFIARAARPALQRILQHKEFVDDRDLVTSFLPDNPELLALGGAAPKAAPQPAAKRFSDVLTTAKVAAPMQGSITELRKKAY